MRRHRVSYDAAAVDVVVASPAIAAVVGVRSPTLGDAHAAPVLVQQLPPPLQQPNDAPKR